jgi:hypothetical protein
MVVALIENLMPELHPTALDKVSGLLLEHRVVVRQGNKFLIAEALSVRDVR